ncbi:hypothetical protein DXG01_006034 [Tephrocybe rancida]|nr:hypothetical protein DXG01_006034 [Tephrocybe rancida]
MNDHISARHPLRYPCVECDREFSTPNALRDHYRGSSSERHPNCPRCGLGFRDVAERDAHHSETHTQVACDVCNGELVYADLLDQHWKDRAPPHSRCRICQDGFKDVAQLTLHLADPEVHPQCPDCRARFKDQDDLEAHAAESHRAITEVPTRVELYMGPTALREQQAATDLHRSLQHASVNAPRVQPIASAWGQREPPTTALRTSSLRSGVLGGGAIATQPLSYLGAPSSPASSRNPGSGVLPPSFRSWNEKPNQSLGNSFQVDSLSPRPGQARFDRQSGSSWRGSGSRFEFLGNGNFSV